MGALRRKEAGKTEWKRRILEKLEKPAADFKAAQKLGLVAWTGKGLQDDDPRSGTGTSPQRSHRIPQGCRMQGQGEGPWPGHDLGCFKRPQGTVGAEPQPKIKQAQPIKHVRGQRAETRVVQGEAPKIPESCWGVTGSS